MLNNEFEVIEDWKDWKIIRTNCDCMSPDHILHIEIDDSENHFLNEAYFEYRLTPKEMRINGNWFSRLWSRFKVAFKIIFNIEVEYDESFLFRDKAHLYSLSHYICKSIENMENNVEKRLFYKGFIGEYEFDDEDEMYYGRVSNLDNDFIDFKGKDKENLYKSFKDSVESYLEFSKEV